MQNHVIVYNNYPKNLDQTEARDFWIYVIARDSYCKLTKTKLKFEVVNCD